MGLQCRHVLHKGSVSKPTPLKSSHKGKICRKCEQWYTDTVRATNNSKWVREVLEAIESVRGWSSEGALPNEASLWHLYELDPNNGGVGKFSERGECLGCLNTRTLDKLRNWLEANEEEAVTDKGYKRGRFVGLRADVGLLARLGTLPPNKSLLPDKRDTPLPLHAVAYTRSGRVEDLTEPILAEFIRRQRGFISEREREEYIESKIGVPRSTTKRRFQRMNEIGMTLSRFTPEDLAYVIFGETRGRKRKL